LGGEHRLHQVLDVIFHTISPVCAVATAAKHDCLKVCRKLANLNPDYLESPSVRRKRYPGAIPLQGETSNSKSELFSGFIRFLVFGASLAEW
jgi:hypothetical protein